MTLCLATVVSVNSVAINKYDTTHTTHPTTTEIDYPTTTEKVYPTTTEKVYPTTRFYNASTIDPWITTTHKPNPDLNCYGHFTYKEGHNIIVDGKYNRHHDPEECEISCYVSRVTFHLQRFIKFLLYLFL